MTADVIGLIILARDKNNPCSQPRDGHLYHMHASAIVAVQCSFSLDWIHSIDFFMLTRRHLVFLNGLVCY